MMALPTEAICPPPNTSMVTKSPITTARTKIEPMVMPGLHSGTMTCQRVCHSVAPLSTAASSTARSIRIMALKMGTIMQSVYKCT